MGLFDTVKLKANALAADAERAGKVTAAQARTVVLQNEIRKAERELGHSAFSLIESTAITHPDLEAAVARLRDARQALTDKEAEIAGLRHGAESGDSAAPAPAPVAEEPATAETPEPVEVATGKAKKPEAKRRAPAAKKPAAKKAAPTKRQAPAAKRPAAKKAAPTKRQAPAEKWPASQMKTGPDDPAGGELIAEARAQVNTHSHLTG